MLSRETTLTLTDKLKALYRSQDTLPKLLDEEGIVAQSLKDYYITLQLILKGKDHTGNTATRLYDQVAGTKIAIPMENVFSPLDADHPAVSKVLLLGGAGIGKTTLLHYLAYQWGSHRLFQHPFDYVFKMRLKALLNAEWHDFYHERAVRKNPLACFIHHNLYLQQTDIDIDLEEIINITDKNKVLLLLDGYDEIAHRAYDSHTTVCRVMDAVFAYPYVVMASRPNALTLTLENRFERQIENTGLDERGIEKYIHTHFQHQIALAHSLKTFLNANPAVQTLCTIPINTAILCLVWADDTVRQKLTGALRLTDLYQAIILWLGKRYLTRYKPADAALLYDEHVWHITELQFLKEIAYSGFQTGQLAIDKKLLSSLLMREQYSELTIAEVDQYGLLKPEGDGREIAKQNHYFVHLTFQEYLTAHWLKEQLTSPEPTRVRETAHFIGIHRNEPRYLMTFKFLAGLVTQEAGEHSALLVTRFWEAIACNVDGILELGIDAKMTLWMHLLAEAERQDPETHLSRIDSRIPHLTIMQSLIDETVLQDLAHWSPLILQSGYVSVAIAEMLKTVLATHVASYTQQTLIAAIDILSTLTHKPLLGGRTDLFVLLMNQLMSVSMSVQQVILQKLKLLAQGSPLPRGIQQTCTHLITPLLDNPWLGCATLAVMQCFGLSQPAAEKLLLGLQARLAHPTQAAITTLLLQQVIALLKPIDTLSNATLTRLTNTLKPLMCAEDASASSLARAAFSEVMRMMPHDQKIAHFRVGLAQQRDALPLAITEQHLRAFLDTLPLHMLSETAEQLWQQNMHNMQATSIDIILSSVIARLTTSSSAENAITQAVITQLKATIPFKKGGIRYVSALMHIQPDVPFADAIFGSLQRTHETECMGEFLASLPFSLAESYFHVLITHEDLAMRTIAARDVLPALIHAIPAEPQWAALLQSHSMMTHITTLFDTVLPHLLASTRDQDAYFIFSSPIQSIGLLLTIQPQIQDTLITWTVETVRYWYTQCAEKYTRYLNGTDYASQTQSNLARDFRDKVVLPALHTLVQALSPLYSLEILHALSEDLALREIAIATLERVVTEQAQHFTVLEIWGHVQSLLTDAVAIAQPAARSLAAVIIAHPHDATTTGRVIQQVLSLFAGSTDRWTTFTVLQILLESLPPMQPHTAAPIWRALHPLFSEKHFARVCFNVWMRILPFEIAFVTVLETLRTLILVDQATAIHLLASWGTTLTDTQAQSTLCHLFQPLLQDESCTQNNRKTVATALISMTSTLSTVSAEWACDMLPAFSMAIQPYVDFAYEKPLQALMTALDCGSETLLERMLPFLHTVLALPSSSTGVQASVRKCMCSWLHILLDKTPHFSPAMAHRALHLLRAIASQEINYQRNVTQSLPLMQCVHLCATVLSEADVIEALMQFQPLLTESTPLAVSEWAVSMMIACVSAQSPLSTVCVMQVLQLIQPLLDDSRFLQYHQSFEAIRYTPTSINSAHLLSETGHCHVVLHTLMTLLQSAPASAQLTAAYWAILQPLLSRSEAFIQRPAVATVCLLLTQCGDTDLADTVLQTVQSLLHHPDTARKSDLFYCLYTIAHTQAHTITLCAAVHTILETELQNPASTLHADAAHSMVALMTTQPNPNAFATHLWSLLTTLLHQPHTRETRCTIVGGLGELIRVMPLDAAYIQQLFPTIEAALLPHRQASDRLSSEAHNLMLYLCERIQAMPFDLVLTQRITTLMLSRMAQSYAGHEWLEPWITGMLSLPVPEALAVLSSVQKKFGVRQETFERTLSQWVYKQVNKTPESALQMLKLFMKTGYTTIIITVAGEFSADTDTSPDKKERLAKLLLEAIPKETERQYVTTCIHTLPLLSIMQLGLLQHPSPTVRAETITCVTAQFNAQKTALADASLIGLALQVIGYTTPDDDATQAVHLLAKNCLYQWIESIVNGTPYIVWLNQHYAKLLTYSSESRPFLKAIYHHLLYAGHFNEDSHTFVMHCIAAGFPASITRAGEMIVEGQRYALLANSNESGLATLINTALSQSQDRLALQYTTHEPLCLNSGSSITMAASDVKRVLNLTGSHVLITDQWLLSWLQPSNTQNALFLLESRDIFGDRIVYTFDEKGMTSAKMTLHPEAATSEWRETVFGRAEDIAYTATTVILTASEHTHVLSNPRHIQCYFREAYGERTTVYSVTQWVLLARELDQVAILARAVETHEIRITRNETALAQLAEKLGITQAQMARMTQEIANLDINADDVDHVFMLLEHMNTLNAVIQSETTRQAEQQVIARIRANPYQASFYHTLRSQLNAVYLAAMSVQTDIIHSDKTGLLGNIGQIFQVASNYVPIVGVGVQFFGAMLTYVDQVQQTAMLEHYVHVVDSPMEMDTLAEKVARTLACTALDPNKMRQPQHSLVKMSAELQSRMNQLFIPKRGDTSSTAAIAGQQDAEYIASEVIAVLYAGDVPRGDLDTVARALIDRVQSEYGAPSRADEDNIQLPYSLLPLAGEGAPSGADEGRTRSLSLAAAIVDRGKMLLSMHHAIREEAVLEPIFIADLARTLRTPRYHDHLLQGEPDTDFQEALIQHVTRACVDRGLFFLRTQGVFCCPQYHFTIRSEYENVLPELIEHAIIHMTHTEELSR
ncbi:MAG: hypothetical protein A3J38_03450 [Gammaproteobacteria bacterium RIFCSPHIGHO2_12_FULL_45_9]|nr:MAG: hypothetical protein A3J38_03450 [Gammaproteobacteria bacterium RIFCSPHIGHO2_12_FULL_45_9]